MFICQCLLLSLVVLAVGQVPKLWQRSTVCWELASAIAGIALAVALVDLSSFLTGLGVAMHLQQSVWPWLGLIALNSLWQQAHQSQRYQYWGVTVVVLIGKGLSWKMADIYALLLVLYLLSKTMLDRKSWGYWACLCLMLPTAVDTAWGERAVAVTSSRPALVMLVEQVQLLQGIINIWFSNPWLGIGMHGLESAWLAHGALVPFSNPDLLRQQLGSPWIVLVENGIIGLALAGAMIYCFWHATKHVDQHHQQQQYFYQISIWMMLFHAMDYDDAYQFGWLFLCLSLLTLHSQQYWQITGLAARVAGGLSAMLLLVISIYMLMVVSNNPYSSRQKDAEQCSGSVAVIARTGV